MAYATTDDVQARLTRQLSGDELAVCSTLLDDAALFIDAVAATASAEVKCVVSCRMVGRAIGDGDPDIPIGATQGSMSGLGYSQSWTIGAGSAGELYLSKAERQLLGVGNKIGAYSPVEALVVESDT